MNSVTVHWLGAGLSSRPGFEKLVRSRESRCVLWNRNSAKAREWIREIDLPHVEGREFTETALPEELRGGDLVVSMLPAEFHPRIARICLERGAHLVTTSYLSPEMLAFDTEARARGLVFMNEVGLDPGIDHLFAQILVARMRAAVPAGEITSVDFYSLCGGFPKELRDSFRYRFSWSPLGVLRALERPARWIENGSVREASRAYRETREWKFGAEEFEMYPNRDSLPYREEYGLASLGPSLRSFLRGTLRPAGWSREWQEVFSQIETATPSELARLAEELYRHHAYRKGERDRVCMEVRICARDSAGGVRFEESYRIDEVGEAGADSAMAKLVSIPAVLAVEAIFAGGIPAGVTGAPRDSRIAQKWVDRLVESGCGITLNSRDCEQRPKCRPAVSAISLSVSGSEGKKLELLLE